MTHNRLRTTLAVVAVISSGGLAAAGCGSSSSTAGAVTVQRGTVSVTKFCDDFGQAANDLSSIGSVDAGDVALLRKAAEEAPAAVRADAITVLNVAVKAASATSPTESTDASAPSDRISKWGNKHCPSGDGN